MKERKTDALITNLKAGWVPISELSSRLNWQQHSVRAAMSTLAKKNGTKVERERKGGITSYRINNE